MLKIQAMRFCLLSFQPFGVDWLVVKCASNEGALFVVLVALHTLKEISYKKPRGVIVTHHKWSEI